MAQYRLTVHKNGLAWNEALFAKQDEAERVSRLLLQVLKSSDRDEKTRTNWTTTVTLDE